VDVFNFGFQIVHTRSGGVGGGLHILLVGQINEIGGFSQFISRIAAIHWENNPNLLEAHYESVVA
jgi:hypothetical protein